MERKKGEKEARRRGQIILNIFCLTVRGIKREEGVAADRVRTCRLWDRVGQGSAGVRNRQWRVSLGVLTLQCWVMRAVCESDVSLHLPAKEVFGPRVD